MKLFIPELGTRFKLTKAFKCVIAWEERNFTLIKHFYPNLLAEHKQLHDGLYATFHIGWEDGLTAVGATNAERSSALYGSTKNDIGKRAHAWLDKQRGDAASALKLFKQNNPVSYKFDKGTILEVDRIYIRKGAEKFSSLTFKWRLEKKTLRFWLPLDVVNQIECEVY